MSASFSSASSQGLVLSSAPISGFPISVAMWIYPTTTGSEKHYWRYGNSASATAGVDLGQSSGNKWQMAGDDGSTFDRAEVGTVTANQWAFVVGRFLAANERYMSVLEYNGPVSAVSSTVNKTFSGNWMSVGRRNGTAAASFWDGSIAEFWYTNVDIQPGGGALQESVLRQLAFGGPFSLPHIAKDIVEYHSFRRGLSSDEDVVGEVYFGAAGRQAWVDSTNAGTLGPHPPLPYWYRSPADRETALIV